MNKKTKCILALSTALALTQPMNAVADGEERECYSLNVREEISKNPVRNHVGLMLCDLYIAYHFDEVKLVQWDRQASKDFIAREIDFAKKWLPYFDSLVEKYGIEKSCDMTYWKASQELDREMEQKNKAAAKTQKEAEKSK